MTPLLGRLVLRCCLKKCPFGVFVVMMTIVINSDSHKQWAIFSNSTVVCCSVLLLHHCDFMIVLTCFCFILVINLLFHHVCLSTIVDFCCCPSLSLIFAVVPCCCCPLLSLLSFIVHSCMCLRSRLLVLCQP